ncbi:class II fumarate hydratase [Adhaeretor mobilis]|uniref:Fumarate hydratase class II n=1 Tax=Adhaeretor mobilis TaxID=1930276 RepID=A0A517MQ38_9BACT|nr:class II fumarate hydratase [Adhaeretor mobilis]QDS96982.1 Fumarate hydratase class II [Adhaeretor mobilis]
MANTRTERDTMGEMQVPKEALYGASTARAVENFPIAHEPVPAAVIHAFGHLKAACAQANLDLGKLDAGRAQAIIAAAEEVAAGKHDAHFPVDIYQTGSGTSTNMNANEVIANVANAGIASDGDKIHPNDHVNMGQSSNDTFPTAMSIAAASEIEHKLIPALNRLSESLTEKSNAWDSLVKIGRTHLMDATPIRMGQVFGGYAAQASNAVIRAGFAMEELKELAIGGTAVGTGINTHPEFAEKVALVLNERLKFQYEYEFLEAVNHPEAQATKDGVVTAHGYLKSIAVGLSKIANDIRHLGSGPRAGLYELLLPATQPGSSIMPGKVNPVMCESVMQVACRVIGNDSTVTTAALGGVGSLFELNVAMPVMIDAFLESVKLLANVSDVFVDKLLAGLEVNEARCQELLDRSLMTVTSLAPALGYETCAKLAKQALAEDTTIRALVLSKKLMGEEELDKLLDAEKMTRPS